MINYPLEFFDYLESKNITYSRFKEYEKYYYERPKTYRKAHGFNVSIDKNLAANNDYFLTDIPADVQLYGVSTQSQKKSYIYYENLYYSLDEAFKQAKNYRQVFAGLNHFRRDVLVADIDKTMTPCFSEEEEKQRIEYIHKKCDEYKMPYPSYIEFHTDSGHCQFGWYLSEYFVEYGTGSILDRSSEFRWMVKAISKLFGSDGLFGCANMKNPYHKLNHAYFYSKNLINPEILMKKIKKALEINNIDFDIKPSKRIKTNNENNLTSIPLNDSRNCYALKETTKWIYKYMREHNKSAPPLSSVINYFSEAEERSLKFNGKPSIESYSKIKASSQGALSFCQREYSQEIADKCIIANLPNDILIARRESSLLTRQVKKGIKYFKAKEMKESHISQKVIAKTLECTQPSISIILNNTSEEDILNTFKIYYIKHQNSKQEKHIELIDDIINILKSQSMSIDDLFENKGDK